MRFPQDLAGWPHAEHSRLIHVKPHRWHVQIMGQGPDLLFLHGAGGATHSWRDVLPLLAPHYRCIAVDLPGLLPALDRFEARCDAMAKRGVDVDALPFEASYGRTSMEYYDGFVFGFYSEARPDLPPVATGGRYDALTRRLGQGRDIPAVGGVIRPDLVLDLGGLP